jgi:hypothetical protein
MIRLRRWATPLVSGSFLLIAATGLLMLCEAASPAARVAHEWLSLVLLAAAALHLVVNARGFLGALRPRLARVIVGAFAALTLLLAIPSRGPGGDPGRRVFVALMNAPLERVAAAAGRSPQELRSGLERAGLRVPAEQTSLAEIARLNHAHPPDLLGMAFAAPRR